MDAKLPEINLGAAVCDRLRTLYHDTKPWIDCYRDVAVRFTELKAIARKFYCDKTEHEMLMELARYSPEDLKEAFENGNENTRISCERHTEAAAGQAHNDPGKRDAETETGLRIHQATSTRD